jgi:hypothetical protein
LWKLLRLARPGLPAVHKLSLTWLRRWPAAAYPVEQQQVAAAHTATQEKKMVSRTVDDVQSALEQGSLMTEKKWQKRGRDSLGRDSPLQAAEVLKETLINNSFKTSSVCVSTSCVHSAKGNGQW